MYRSDSSFSRWAETPSDYGTTGTGVDIIIGEAQHLALRPNFGGPGLGIFGVRFNDNQKTHIRSTPGRYIGKTCDENGDECLSMVLYPGSNTSEGTRRHQTFAQIKVLSLRSLALHYLSKETTDWPKVNHSIETFHYFFRKNK